MTVQRLPVQDGMKRVAVLCILRSGAEMLLLRRRKEPHQGLYVPVGGHVDPFESPRDAVLREVREEAGFVLPSVTYRGTLVETSPTPYNWIVFVYSAEVPRTEPPPCEEGDLCWVGVGELAGVPTPAVDAHMYRLVAAERPFALHVHYDEALRVLRLDEELRGETLVPPTGGDMQGDATESTPIGETSWTPHHVRRAERAIVDEAELLALLRRGRYVSVALCDGQEPYVVTLSYGLDATRRALYFHCAPQGHKLDAIRANPRACATVVEDRGYLQGECAHAYASLVLRGSMHIVADGQERQHAMDVLLRHLEDDPEVVRRTQLADESVYERVTIVRMDIAAIAGKRGR